MQYFVQIVLNVYVHVKLLIVFCVQNTLWRNRHPTIANTWLLWTDTTLLPRTTKKCKDATSSITDSQYYRTVHIECGPKLLF